MKEEILTAKEWLYKENHLTEELNRKGFYVIEAGLMEKYANYRNRILEDRIKEFREDTLKGKWIKYLQICDEYCLEEYDKHFNIENK